MDPLYPLVVSSTSTNSHALSIAATMSQLLSSLSSQNPALCINATAAPPPTPLLRALIVVEITIHRAKRDSSVGLAKGTHVVACRPSATHHGLETPMPPRPPSAPPSPPTKKVGAMVLARSDRKVTTTVESDALDDVRRRFLGLPPPPPPPPPPLPAAMVAILASSIFGAGAGASGDVDGAVSVGSASINSNSNAASDFKLAISPP
mmetsp:Transcript_4257/g.9163  ORF Transcript_4257/g.9163 Transcript_4257/m.9163 type:complete len:206 (-) Transcript_4257:63-680(-)